MVFDIHERAVQACRAQQGQALIDELPACGHQQYIDLAVDRGWVGRDSKIGVEGVARLMEQLIQRQSNMPSHGPVSETGRDTQMP
jgi:hypothetical protein